MKWILDIGTRNTCFHLIAIIAKVPKKVKYMSEFAFVFHFCTLSRLHANVCLSQSSYCCVVVVHVTVQNDACGENFVFTFVRQREKSSFVLILNLVV